MPVTTINSYEEFTKTVNSGDIVIIDYWATWCGPCRMISPVFERLSDVPDFSHIRFCKVDVDEQGQVAEESGIRAMPTFILFKDGNIVDQLAGANPERLQHLVQQATAT